jgi:hypothetical protein
MQMMTDDMVMLATADEDLGLCPRGTAMSRAADLAHELARTVTLRHPMSDKVIASVQPSRKRRLLKNGAMPKAAE